MVPITTVIACVITLLVSLVLPIVVLIVMAAVSVVILKNIRRRWQEFSLNPEE